MTDEWKNRGVKKGSEYAILTDEITKAWSGMTTREYKNPGVDGKNLESGEYRILYGKEDDEYIYGNLLFEVK